MPLQKFEFIPDGGSFVPLLKSMLAAVEQQAELPAAAKEQLLFQAKVVLTELLTNAIKHSGASRTLFTIQVDHQILRISKSDSGNPMELISHPALSSVGDTLQLSCDVMHILQATVKNNSTLLFSCIEAPEVPGVSAMALADHFGLLIITKVASEFYYQFDEAGGINLFHVDILL